MSRKILLLILILAAAVRTASPEIASLSGVFALGKGLLDPDGDGFGEKPALSIIIPDNPTPIEMALAADIAARANLESLAVDFGLVRRESEAGGWASLSGPILIGSRLALSRDIAKESRIDLDGLGPQAGLITAFIHKGQRGILCVAGSEEALLQTGRAFFLRWPYFWEVWGRENGSTFLSFENDLRDFLAQEDILIQKTVIREAVYGFPPASSAKGALRSLDFRSGEIRKLTVEVHFTDEDDQKKAGRALELLRQQRQKGQRTEVLSYPGCASLVFELRYGKKAVQVELPRPGSTRRLLTPAFKDLPPGKISEREFDLLTLFTLQGLYSDQDKDGIPDGVETSVIIPQTGVVRGLPDLVSKIVLATAGASFPLVYLDTEVEHKRALGVPLLVGANSLTADLQKTGKLKIPALEPAWGVVRTVSKAVDKTSALVILSQDSAGLEKTLAYMGRTFPFLDAYGDGRPSLGDVVEDFQAFLRGEKGAAEAYFERRMENFSTELKDKELESCEIRIVLPSENKKFEEALRRSSQASIRAKSLSVRSSTVREAKVVFEKKRELVWEAEEALSLLKDKLGQLTTPPPPLRVSLGVSESPEVRLAVKKRVEQTLQAAGVESFEVEVLSAYKQGFFWLIEKVLPALKGKDIQRLTVQFSEEQDDLGTLKRFYVEPVRWLQELYPADEILASGLNLPLEKIDFEVKKPGGPVYLATGFDEKNAPVYQQGFSPRCRNIQYLAPLPEWGASKITTGWVRMETGDGVLLDSDLRTDLERFWEFYQEEALRPVHDYILKKTGQNPTFSKQPYFKRLLVELQLSEPDYKLGLDEEIVSSLEAIHDEVYFDTLDMLRGITRFDPADEEAPPDTSRSSAPGNILPLVLPSLEGSGGRVKVVFEDWASSAPRLEVRWKETGGEEASRSFEYPKLTPRKVSWPELIYNGQEERIERLVVEADFEKEADYLALLDILENRRLLLEQGLIEDVFARPRLGAITVRLGHKEWEKDETLPVSDIREEEKPAPPPPSPEESIVPTTEIIPPDRCLEIVERLGGFPDVHSYIGGRSFEKRRIPILEIFTPQAQYVSFPRLVTFKPTLHISARQHANEVSSTNYALKFAELLAKDRTYQDVVRKMNVVIQPLENPDGAELAYSLHEVEPFHSLHAGRYGSLGVDIGYQLPGQKALLPEAAVRAELSAKWQPDIYLNLHGYPSHEWVQPFSGYSPYLFRDYWIPKGWFVYYKTLSLPIYEKWREAGQDLLGLIIQELQADERIRESNKKLYARYQRWASRWQPHLDFMEQSDGLNVYQKRRASQENKLTLRSQVTFVEQTPKLMDETASGPWLNFLCEQGLAYLKAHVKFLIQAKSDTARIEEEVLGRIRLSFERSRPPTIRKER